MIASVLNKVLRSVSLFAFLALSFSSVAQDGPQLPRALSRAIIPHCEFVYEAELDLALAFPVDPFSLDIPVVQLRFKDEWHPKKEELVIRLAKAPKSDWFMGTFMSMSTANNHLYRVGRFQLGHLDIKGNFVPDTQEFEADFGRRFGEACYTHRHEKAQYFEREVTIIDPFRL